MWREFYSYTLSVLRQPLRQGVLNVEELARVRGAKMLSRQKLIIDQNVKIPDTLLSPIADFKNQRNRLDSHVEFEKATGARVAAIAAAVGDRV